MSTTQNIATPEPDPPRRRLTDCEMVDAAHLRIERGNGAPRHGRHAPVNVDELRTVAEVRAREGATPRPTRADDDAQTRPIPRLGVVVGDPLAGDGPHDPDGGYAL